MSSPASTLSTGVPASGSAPADHDRNNDIYDASRADSGVNGAASAAAAAPARFADFGLPTAILRAIRELGYETPTAIQHEAIPALLLGCDVTGVAQTGTGKTAAYGLPLLTAIDPNTPGVQALVLVPTRELAIQVTDALSAFAAALPTVGIAAIYGGSSMGKQITALKRGAQVVVGTPGRVIDLIERKSLRLENVTFAVLDEADEMLRMGFAEDVDRILTEVPSARQTALFSATMPKEIRRVAARHLRRPVDVSVAASATPVVNIDQSYIVLPFRDKALALQRLIAVSDAEAAVVFVRTRNACDELGSALIGAGVKAAYISGDVSQNERERTIDRLRGGQVDVLVATDVAARGMDVERIGLVVNYDVPADAETYIHRVGRTGRAGRNGSAVTFFTPKETSRLRVIEKTIGRKLDEISVPSAAQVLDRQAEAALGAATARHAAGRLTNYANALAVAADIAGLTQSELAAALLATVVGDDGAPLVEIKAHVSGRGGRDRGRSDSRSDNRDPRERRSGFDRSRNADRERAPRRDRADRFERPRHDSPRDERRFESRHESPRGGQQRERYRNQSWESPSRRSDRDDRRSWDGPRQDRATEGAPRRDSNGGFHHGGFHHNGNSGSSDSRTGSYSGAGSGKPRSGAFGDKPGKSKPRWDAARRAERSAGYDAQPASRTGAWSSRDAASRNSARTDRPMAGRGFQGGQRTTGRRGQRTVA